MSELKKQHVSDGDGSPDSPKHLLHHHQQQTKNAHHDDAHPPPAKRRRSDHVRTRVSRACDRCKSRKTRCSGKWPCAHCYNIGLGCSFNASYRRGRIPSIEPASDTEMALDEQAVAVESQSHDNEDVIVAAATTTPGFQPIITLPSPVSVEQQRFISSAPSTGGGAAAADNATRPDMQRLLEPEPGPEPETENPSTQRHSAQSSRNSPEPAQVDQQGHYVGPASGASFLLRIQRRLQQQSPLSSSEASIFTFGDLPFPETDSSVLVLPPKAEADDLLSRYFEYASATHRFLHRPTVSAWLDELYETNGAMRDRATARSRKALLFMVLAYAHNYPKGSAVANYETGAVYFNAAEDQLAGERGAIRLTSVQARLAQCLYLASHSRLNHCWTLFGTTAHLALALGIHRRRFGELGSSLVDFVDLECRKRTFWCMYNLDTYLSAALGRPRSFHDDDIDQDLPVCLDDAQIQRQSLDLAAAGPQSVMSGSVAHMRLSRITANVLRDLYGIRPRSTERQLRLAAAYSDELADWRRGMAYLLDARFDAALLQPVFLRQSRVLNLAFWHVCILLHRPFLLNSFASLTNYSVNRSIRSAHAGDVQRHIQLCLDAAAHIMQLVDEINMSGQLYQTFWFTRYFAFCAVVVIYVYAIQRRGSSLDDYLPTLQAAMRCQTQLSALAKPGSLAERYGLVLRELRVEMVVYNPSLRSVMPETTDQGVPPDEAHSDLFIPIQQQQHGHEQSLDAALTTGGGSQPFPENTEPSPTSSVAQMTGWGRFDSLVSGGLGGYGWEAILSDNPIEGWDLGSAQI